MTTILSTSTTIAVSEPGTSAIAVLSASMAPGTWARLEPANDQNSFLGVGSVSGSMISYSNSMPWNPVSRAIEIVGEDHNYGHPRHVRYVEASNQFVLVADNAGLGTMGHGYDHNAVNPHTGDLYNRLFTTFSGEISVMRKPLGASTFAPIPEVPASEQVAIGACWWSGSFAGAGRQGCLVVFNSGNATGSSNDGQIVAFDPLSGKWFYNKAGKAPFYGSGYTYHSVIEYSAKKNVAVYGGGEVAPNKLWRLNADGSSVAMPDVPSGKGVGVREGLLVDEPVSGNFLLLSAGELWELNPSGSGSWTQLTGARVPPGGVGVPGPTDGQHMICASIDTHGVVAYITQPSSTGGSFFLYKHV